MARAVQAAGACHLESTQRVAHHEDAFALKGALAGIDDLFLICSDRQGSAVGFPPVA
jgi:hypothetical protein